MGMLFGFLGTSAFVNFMNLYLLTMTVHILALIYVTKKDTLGWLSR
jgi:hypothetical protein